MMRKKFKISLMFFILSFSSLAIGTTIDQLIEINGTLYMNVTYDDGTTQLVQVVYVNGTAYLNFTFDDGGSRLVELENYVKTHEGGWSATGVSIRDFIFYLNGAIEWLMGLNDGIPSEFQEIGEILDSYFASDYDVFVLQQQIADLSVRLRFLENAMEDFYSEAYCQGKIATMLEYNLSWVKCGKNSTYYYRIEPDKWDGREFLILETADENRKPNITVSFANSSVLLSGTSNSVKFYLKNEGNKLGRVDVWLEVPEGWSYEPSKTTFTVMSGGNVTAEFSVDVPKNEDGEYVITIVVNSTEGEKKFSFVRTVEVPLTDKITGYFLAFGEKLSSDLLYQVVLAVCLLTVFITIFRKELIGYLLK